MLLDTLLETAQAQLLSSSATPRLDSEILLAKVLGWPRTKLLANGDEKLSAAQLKFYQSLLARRLQGEPVAYLLGEKEFWSLPFKVTPDTLIPRPETELLVSLCLELLAADEHCVVADLGTGSGAVAIALAKERKQWSIAATDYSKETLHVAKENGQLLKVGNVAFYSGDWCTALPAKKYDAIVSNPPYVAEDDERLKSDGVVFEPVKALASARDGYADLVKIIQQAKGYLKQNGWLLLEHGYEQQQKLMKFLYQQGYKNIAAHQDLQGLPRVVIGQWYG